MAKFPKVVSITPPAGSQDVDPATRQLVITFDRPMTAGSWSIVGGGSELPRLGRPAYNPARTILTVPLSLEPGRSYRFGLNGGGRFFGFTSEEGYPLEPVEVSWQTRAR
jgi:hypothetical protein